MSDKVELLAITVCAVLIVGVFWGGRVSDVSAVLFCVYLSVVIVLGIGFAIRQMRLSRA